MLTGPDRKVLSLLARLPFVPARVLGEVLGGSGPSAIYRRLRLLEERGLARPLRVPRQGTHGGRPLTLWQLTPDGQRLLAPSDRGRPGRRLPRQWPRLVATYELLGALAAGLSTDGRGIALEALETPWRRVASARSGLRSVELPAAALLAAPSGGTRPTSVLLLPDLGWAPVTLQRRRLASLVALRAAAHEDLFPTLVVGTVSAQGRVEIWRELIERVAAERGEPPLPALVVTWPEVRERRLGTLLKSGPSSGQPAEAAGHPTGLSPRTVTRGFDGAGVEQQAVLQLLGRHPFLPLTQLATLLDIRARDARVRLEHLAAAGLVRWVGTRDDPEHLPLGLTPEELARLELSELTREGLRELAASLDLTLARAEQLHGLAGGGPEQPTRSRRALVRALTHTLGADAVFVALHLALSDGRGNGLVRWDNAAASMRGRCRPDGYGICRLDGQDLGFFLEYDRGTESARDYAAKWAAYYAYRDSGRAAADYASFPTILVVTAGPEERVLRSARAASVARPGSTLPILVTTTGWIAGHPQGIVGPIWRTPQDLARESWPRSGRQQWVRSKAHRESGWSWARNVTR